MKAADYWNRLNGYWILFKDKPAFTIIWDAMIKAAEEYAQLLDAIKHPGILRCPDTVTLNWEKITIDAGNVLIINNEYDPDEDDPENAYLNYAITSIPTMRNGFAGGTYIEGTDYTIDYTTSPPALTWIIADPGADSYLADTVSIDYDLLGKFYNTELLDLDLAAYDGERKWIPYACIRHLGFQHTPTRMSNIIAILAGVPFSKYYGTFTKSEDNASCSINYAVKLTEEYLAAGGYVDYDDFMNKNELENYCLLDDETGDVYDGDFPDGSGLTLCHKQNLGYEAGKYYIILPGETISEVFWDLPYAAGELYPVGLPFSVQEYEMSTQYDPTPIPLHILGTVNCLVNAEYPSEYAHLIRDGELMRLGYVDNITIDAAGIKIIDSTNIVIADPLVHILRVGEEMIVIKDGGDATYCSIVSGYFNELEQTYHVTLDIEVDPDEIYSVTIPIHKDAMVYVNDNGDYTVSFISDIQSDDQLPMLMQCAANVASQRIDNVYDDIEAGDSILGVEAADKYSVGDMISVTSDGEQDFYRITNVFPGSPPAHLAITPTARRGYASGATIYNHGTLLTTKRAILIQDPQWNDIELANITNILTFMDIWCPGIEIYLDSDIDDPDSAGAPTVYDMRFWQRLDKEAKKENKE